MFGESLGDQYEEFTDYIKSQGFKYHGGGSFREAYLRGHVIIKVPSTTDGIIDNRIEARAWRLHRANPTSRGLYLAPCRLLPNLCLMMPEVNTRVDNYPDWTSRVDNEQVGFYKGRVVAYDYACDMVERREWETEWYGEIQSDWYGQFLRAERRATSGR